MAKKDYEEKYTHPEMREEIKEEIKQSDKGGEPGQWSARKSQLLTQEYEKRGGGYKGEQDESQKNLQQWTEEEWQTQDGDAQARGDEETARYLPKKAWENMSERRETGNRAEKARRFPSGSTVRREHPRGEAGPGSGAAKPSAKRLRRPERRRSKNQSPGPLQRRGRRDPHLRETAPKP